MIIFIDFFDNIQEMLQRQQNKTKKLWKNIKTEKNINKTPSNEKRIHFSMKNSLLKISGAPDQSVSHSVAFLGEKNKLEDALSDFKNLKNFQKPVIDHEQIEEIDIDEMFSNNKILQFQQNLFQNYNTFQQAKAQSHPLSLNDSFNEIKIKKKQEKPISKQTCKILNSQSFGCKNVLMYEHEMSQNEKLIQGKQRMLLQLQNIKKQVLNLNNYLKNIYQASQQFKEIFRSWLAQKIQPLWKQKIAAIVYELEIQKQKNQQLSLQNLKLRESHKKTTTTYQNRLQAKDGEINELKLFTKGYNEKIRELNEQLQRAHMQLLTLNEQIFDYEQKTAQIDLEIEDKVKKFLNREQAENNTLTIKHYNQIIKEQQLKIEQLKNKIRLMSVNSIQIDKIRQLTAGIEERETLISLRENQINNRERNMLIKQEQLTQLFQDLKQKEDRLKLQQKKLSTQKNQMPKTNFLEMVQHPFHKKQFRTQYQLKPEMHHRQQYKITQSWSRQSKKQDLLFRNKIESNSPKKQSPNFERPYNKCTKSRQKQSGYNKPKNKSIFSSSINYRNNLSNNAANDKLHDLGSKLERLKEEIKKQIKDAK